MARVGDALSSVLLSLLTGLSYRISKEGNVDAIWRCIDPTFILKEGSVDAIWRCIDPFLVRL